MKLVKEYIGKALGDKSIGKGFLSKTPITRTDK
jgi:hypothetical protein